MKPYQFYILKTFPELKPGVCVRNSIQMAFLSEFEDVETEATVEKMEFEGALSLLRVKSEIKHATQGFIRVYEQQERRRHSFTEYLEPVDFAAYLEPDKKLVIFQASKKVCRGVLANLRGKPCGLELAEVEVDFGKVLVHCGEYFGAWFHGVSSRVQTAGLSGNQIQSDPVFTSFMKKGELSNVTIPWMFEGAEHRLMVTGRGGVVLVEDYKDNLGLELRLLMDVHDKLLSQVWSERAFCVSAE